MELKEDKRDKEKVKNGSSLPGHSPQMSPACLPLPTKDTNVDKGQVSQFARHCIPSKAWKE